MTRRWVKWGIAALVLAALVFGTMRIVSQRQALQAANARHPALLEWMYGPVARGARTGEEG